MTTVVYKDGVMAGDSCVSQGTLQINKTTKVFKNKAGWLMGFAGEFHDLPCTKEWFMDLNKFLDKENPFSFQSTAECILVDPVGKMYTIFGQEKALLNPMKGKFMVSGSGSDIAVGALAMGATAREAVEIACKYDGKSSKPIKAVYLDDK